MYSHLKKSLNKRILIYKCLQKIHEEIRYFCLIPKNCEVKYILRVIQKRIK